MTEKTLKSYLEKNVRIQLVQIDSGKIYFEVRKNRKLLIRSDIYAEAIVYFCEEVNINIKQLNLF